MSFADFTDSWLETIPFNERMMRSQFFTPINVADFMASWVLRNNPRTVLDPSVGTGRLYSACMRVGGRFKFIGIDNDDRLIAKLSDNGTHSDRFICEDYLASPLRNVDAIISNPPYLARKRRMVSIANRLYYRTGIMMPEAMNLYTAFVMRSLYELSEGGRMVCLVPTGFMYDASAFLLRNALYVTGALKTIIHLADPHVVFPEARTSSCLILCEKDGVAIDPLRVIHTISSKLPKNGYVDGFTTNLVSKKTFSPKDDWRLLGY